MTTFECSRRLIGALVGVAMAAAVVIVSAPAASATGHDRFNGPTPIALFPAWHFTRLTVTAHNQRVDPNCPRSGTFEDLANFDPGPEFSQVCRDELLTLRYDPNSHKPIRLRFSEQPA